MIDSSIYHTCSAFFASSGAPILSLKTFKVLGIHYGISDFEYNNGTFIKYAIDEFFKYYIDIFDLNPFQIIRKNNLKQLKKLYDNNKYILTQKDEHLCTLLHLSVKCNNYEITKFLLEKGINYDEPDENGNTALCHSSGKIRQLLRSNGAIAEHYCARPFPNGIYIYEKEENKIDLIYKQFLRNGLVDDLILIKKDNRIIGKRFIRKIKLEKDFYS